MFQLCPNSMMPANRASVCTQRPAILAVWLPILTVLIFLMPASAQKAYGAQETLHLSCQLIKPDSASELQVRARLPQDDQAGSMDIVMVDANDGKDMVEGPVNLEAVGGGYEGGFSLEIPDSEIPPEMQEWAALMPSTFVQFRLLPTSAGPATPSGWRVESRIEVTMDFGGDSNTEVDEGGKGPCKHIAPKKFDRRFQNVK